MIELLEILIIISGFLLLFYLCLKFEEKELENQKEIAEQEARDKKIKRDILLLELLLKKK